MIYFCTVLKLTELTKTELTELSSSLVYIYRTKNEILYVGMSSNGITRPLDKQHHVPKAKDQCETLQLIFCDSVQDATTLERVLIRRLKPKFNNPQTNKMRGYQRYLEKIREQDRIEDLNGRYPLDEIMHDLIKDAIK